MLAKNKQNNNTHFIDASGEEFFKKVTNNNELTAKHIQKIMTIFSQKANIDHVAKLVDYDDIVKKDYNLAVTSYVEAKDTRDFIDITELNAELKTTVQKIDQLRADIDAIIAEIEA